MAVPAGDLFHRGDRFDVTPVVSLMIKKFGAAHLEKVFGEDMPGAAGEVEAVKA